MTPQADHYLFVGRCSHSEIDMQHCIDIARHVLTVLSFSMCGIIIALISFRKAS